LLRKKSFTETKINEKKDLEEKEWNRGENKIKVVVVEGD
jgi:hypothetical protein